MNTIMYMWLVMAVPSQNCKEAVSQQKTEAIQKFLEASKSTTNVVGLTSAQDALSKVQDPSEIIRIEKTEPKEGMYGPCFEIYSSEKIKLPRVSKK